MSEVEPLDVAALSRRVRALARWNVILGVVALAALGVALAALLCPGRGGDAASATRYELKDPSGRTHAVIGKAPDGGPGFFVRDRDGEHRLAVQLTADGEPELRLYDADGETRLLIGLTADGTAVLEARDRDGRSTWRAR